MFSNWIKIEKTIFKNIPMIFNISKKEFVKEFAGSKLGVLWAIIRPLAMIMVFWFVFTKFKIADTGKFPYIIWLIAGYIPWLFISDNITVGAGSIRNHSYLVKKVKFPVEILPSIRLLINFYTYSILLIVSFIIFGMYGFLGQINFLLLLYYTLATVIFMSATIRLLSSWVVMSIDVQHGVGVIIQFLFWMTPVMWDPKNYSNLIVSLLKLNPLYYLITGFRDSYLGFGIQTEAIQYHAYFWVFTILLLILSSNVFARLRPEFDDVL